MHLAPAEQEPSLAEIVCGLPLSVVFAEAESIEAVRAGKAAIPLLPPFHVSDEDAYLVLPEDIGLELVDMFRDGDVDLLTEAMRDGLIVLGTIEKEGRGKLALVVDEWAVPAELVRNVRYAETVGVGRGIDPLPVLNQLEHVQCTIASAFVDEQGLDDMLEKPEFAGLSWRVPASQKRTAHVDPTYVWSKHQPDGSIAIECALFNEYEELVVLLRPALLSPLDRPQLSIVP